MPGERPYQAYSEVRPEGALLLSKLRPPRSTSALIERPELCALLERVLECQLTLLAAPAGFGKTTLLQQWLSERQGQATFPPVAWISLDSGDNDPWRFWRYLAAASQAFQPCPAAALSSVQSMHGSASFGLQALQQWVGSFVNEITRLDCQGLLMLDDYHVIEEPQIQQTLAFLLEQLPPGLHLVLITRTDPPFSLTRLRAKNQLLEIHAAHLVFARPETLRFLQQSLPFVLPQDVAERIEEQMEGWIAGLRLFTLGFQGRTNPDDIQQLLASFTGHHRYVLDYFLTEVLSTQAASVQTFLLQTCHLQRLCASLCESVTGSGGSGQTLAEIERAGLFLQELADPGWYRYHTLFAEAMQNEARQRLGEAQVALCLQRAQRWYEQHHLLDEAIEIAFQRRAFAEALVLLERPRVVTAHLYALVRWLQAMPEELLVTSPTLCFAYANALTFSSSSEQLPAVTFSRVMALLQSAEAQWLAQQQTPAVAEVFALRALISARQGQIPQSAQAARRALELLAPEQMLWLVVCRTTLALEARWLGQFQVAYQAILPGLSAFGETREQEGSIVLKLLLGELCLEQGMLFKAEELFQTLQGETVDGSNDAARALIGLAQLAYEHNQLRQAEQQARQVQAISIALNDGPLQVQATLLLARIAAAAGHGQEASKLLQARLVHLDPAQAVAPYRELLLWQARFQLVAGEIASVQRWLDTLHSEDQPEVSRYQQEQEALLRARWLFQCGAVYEVPDLLKPWQAEALSNERLRSSLQIGLLLSLAYHQLKKPQAARAQFGEVIRLAHSEHYLRLFLDEGEQVAALLSAQLTATREKALQAYIRTLLHAFDLRQQQEAGVPVADPASLLASLSPQEREVLRLLVSGMERQEIARHLVISLNTVKTHIQRLYQKLHVTRRFEALAVARHLDLSE